MSRPRPLTRRLGAMHDVHLDDRRLVHPEDFVCIEIGLLDASVLEGDLAIERRRDAEHDCALDLRLDGVGIDHGAAVHRADDAPHANRALFRHFDLGNLRQIAAEDELQRDATADPVGQRLSPPGFFRGLREDGFGARRLVEKRQPIGDKSCLAAAASSSMKLSVTKTLCDGPTLRQKAVGTPGGSTRTYSTCILGRS